MRCIVYDIWHCAAGLVIARRGRRRPRQALGRRRKVTSNKDDADGNHDTHVDGVDRRDELCDTAIGAGDARTELRDAKTEYSTFIPLPPRLSVVAPPLRNVISSIAASSAQRSDARVALDNGAGGLGASLPTRFGRLAPPRLHDDMTLLDEAAVACSALEEGDVPHRHCVNQASLAESSRAQSSSASSGAPAAAPASVPAAAAAITVPSKRARSVSTRAASNDGQVEDAPHPDGNDGHHNF